jgi:hypothetical protein
MPAQGSKTRMTANSTTSTPGPTPNTVRTADRNCLVVPDGRLSSCVDRWNADRVKRGMGDGVIAMHSWPGMSRCETCVNGRDVHTARSRFLL